MDAPLYASLRQYRHMFCPARRLCLLDQYAKDVLRHEASPGLSHPNRPKPWMLVQHNHHPSHQSSVGRPRRDTIHQPLRENLTVIRSFPLAAPIRRSQWWRLTKSIPPSWFYIKSSLNISLKIKDIQLFRNCSETACAMWLTKMDWFGINRN